MKTWAVAAGLGATAALTMAALPATGASAQPLPTCAPLTSTDASFVSPIFGGDAIDAIAWGGSNSPATACTGMQANDQIKSWPVAQAGVAADFTAVELTGPTPSPTGQYELVYTPGDEVNVASPLCISTVLDTLRTPALLRPCGDGTVVHYDAVSGGATLHATEAAATLNEWQTFSAPDVGDGFFQFEDTTEPTHFSLNIKANGYGSPIISWFPVGTTVGGHHYDMTNSENEIFSVQSAA